MMCGMWFESVLAILVEELLPVQECVARKLFPFPFNGFSAGSCLKLLPS